MPCELPPRGAPPADDLHKALMQTLEQVRAVVHDWPVMRGRILEAADDLELWGGEDRAESAAFLRWLGANHLTFIAVRDVQRNPDGTVEEVAGSALGLPELFER